MESTWPENFSKSPGSRRLRPSNLKGTWCTIRTSLLDGPIFCHCIHILHHLLLLSLFLIALLALIALAIYWLFFVTEGVYLGEKVVVWLYDLYAHHYDTIKDWDLQDEIEYLAQPFVALIGERRRPPLILDVATGTGRLPLAVQLSGLLPDARWVLLDASDNMMQVAKERLASHDRYHFIHQSAQSLPFEDAFFDVVTCLEALEFMPDPIHALDELIRVLRPGGVLLLTNRTGPGARWMPGRIWTRNQVFQLLKSRGMTAISIRPFLVDYEWVSAVKKGAFTSPGRAQDPLALAKLRETALEPLP